MADIFYDLLTIDNIEKVAMHLQECLDGHKIIVARPGLGKEVPSTELMNTSSVEIIHNDSISKTLKIGSFLELKVELGGESKRIRLKIESDSRIKVYYVKIKEIEEIEDSLLLFPLPS